jgi:hypothetical protein
MRQKRTLAPAKRGWPGGRARRAPWLGERGPGASPRQFRTQIEIALHVPRSAAIQAEAVPAGRAGAFVPSSPLPRVVVAPARPSGLFRRRRRPRPAAPVAPGRAPRPRCQTALPSLARCSRRPSAGGRVRLYPAGRHPADVPPAGPHPCRPPLPPPPAIRRPVPSPAHSRTGRPFDSTIDLAPKIASCAILGPRRRLRHRRATVDNRNQEGRTPIASVPILPCLRHQEPNASGLDPDIDAEGARGSSD